jgi:hypothetical protein
MSTQHLLAWLGLVVLSLTLAWNGLVAQGPATGSKPTARSHAARDLAAWGVVGDGVADDTDALQKVIDQGWGDLQLPKGNYRLTRSLVIDLDRVGYTSITGQGTAVLVMEGAGPALRFQGTHNQSADPGNFSASVWDRQRMPLVDGIAIHGKHPDAEGILASGTMQLTITRVHLRGLLHGIHLIENNRNLAIADSHIYENRGIGIFYDDVNLHQSNITNCHISYNGGGGIVSIRGNVRNVHVTGCDLESNMRPDTPATANVLIDCRESRAGTAEVAITGCTIQHNNPSPDSANIRIFGRSLPNAAGADVQEGHVCITGNVLSDVQVNLHLDHCRGVVVSGNTFWQGYQHNLLIENCNSVVIGSNNFDRNPRYSYGNSNDSKNGLLIRNSIDCTLTGLHLSQVRSQPAGLILENCRRMNVDGCTILDCDNAALLLRNVSDSRISDCLLRDDRPDATAPSLQIIGGSGNLVQGNLFSRTPTLEDTHTQSLQNHVSP